MVKSTGRKVVIIGCGNVAWHLAKKVGELKNFSVLIYNHRPNKNLAGFKSILHCDVCDNLDNVTDNADYYFICVSDKYISSVSKKINCNKSDAVILHTSGSMELKEIKTDHKNKAVFYPLQTFSKNDTVNWHEVPLLIETSNTISRSLVTRLARQFSAVHSFYSSKQRLKFHLAAVMVNNFTNALYVAASDLISDKRADFELLMPLIKQTTNKLGNLSPRAAQTGPARRNDQVVMEKHLSLINKNIEMAKIYKELSKLIIKQQTHD